MELKAQKQSAHSKEVYSVAFSPDGKTILSGSEDEAIKVWDAGVGAPNPAPVPKLSVPTLATASLELKAEKQDAHIGDVNSVAFSPDGKTIVAGSYNWTLKVWDAGVSALASSSP